MEKLADFVKSHDAVFLLLDTRESRWLPTVMGMLHGKVMVYLPINIIVLLESVKLIRVPHLVHIHAPACHPYLKFQGQW